VITNVEYLCKMTPVRIYFSFLFILLFNSCAIETAKPSKHQFVNVASDCLTSKDTVIFKNFTHRTGIHVRIIPLTADKIEKRLKRDKTDSELDAVLLHSSYDALILEELKLLQKIPIAKFPIEIKKKYRSEKHSVIGVGFDPYVIIRRPEAIRIKNYASLLHSSGYCTDLEQYSERASFYLFIYRKASSSAKSWIQDFERKKIKTLSKNDTLIYSNFLFTKHSSFEKNKKKSLVSYKSGDLIYPNQRMGGAYYDMPSFGIIKQARNFSNSIALMRHILSSEGNRNLNTSLHTISFFADSRVARFKRYRSSPLRLNKFLSEANGNPANSGQ